MGSLCLPVPFRDHDKAFVNSGNELGSAQTHYPVKGSKEKATSSNNAQNLKYAKNARTFPVAFSKFVQPFSVQS